MSEPTTTTKFNPSDQKELNAFRFSVGSAILFVIVLLLTFVINKSLTSDLARSTSLAVLVIASISSAVLTRRGKSTQGILIMISALILFTAASIFITKGLAISSGIINIIVVATIAVYTLPRKWVTRVIAISFINTIITILIDQYTKGIPTTSSPEVANIISLIIGIIYLLILVFQFPRLALRAKLIVGFIALTALPILILGFQTYLSTRTLLKAQISEEILRTANTTRASVQDTVDSQFSAMQAQARSEEIGRYLGLSPLARSSSVEQTIALDALKGFRKNTSTYVRYYSILDMNGKSILDTNPETQGADYSDRAFFKYVVANRKPYASGMTSIPGDSELFFHFAVPIYSKSNELIGIYLRGYKSTFIQTIVAQNAAINRPTEFSYIIDGANYFVLAHTLRADLLYKTYLPTDDPRVPALIEQGLITDTDFENRFASQAETVEALEQMDATTTFLLPSPATQYELAETAAMRVRNSDWIVLASEPDSLITGLIQGQTRFTVITSIILLAVAALLGLFAATFFSSPITELTEVAQSISAGDFSKRATIRTRDEIGLLADSINLMTDEIQQSLVNLESRVERRTAALSEATQQSEKRAQNLQTIAEISRTISTEKDQEKLLTLITNIVSERFGFYHVGIFLLDSNREFAILRAANSAGGQEMLSRKHSLRIGQTGIVGYVTSTGSPRIALDTGADAVFFNNPSLPDTRSEMALPLTARGTIMGALDVQSKTPNAFTEADISLLSLLADQISIAIDNARLLEAAQASVLETQALFSEYTTESWQKKTESGVVGYRQTTKGGQVLTQANLHTLISSNNGENNVFEVPIKVRDQTIGVLNIRGNSDKMDLSDEDMNIVNAVAERLGLALDNARLFEETSTRATRERQVADITTKIRSSNDPQEMIKTAMEELKQVLGASKVEILQPKSKSSADN